MLKEEESFCSDCSCQSRCCSEISFTKSVSQSGRVIRSPPSTSSSARSNSREAKVLFPPVESEEAAMDDTTQEGENDTEYCLINHHLPPVKISHSYISKLFFISILTCLYILFSCN